MKMRLNKLLATYAGLSRRKADALILQGKVRVDQEICSYPFQQIALKSATIFLCGKRIACKVQSQVFALNKPVGFLCSHHRSHPKEALVYDLVPCQERLFTAGRLDKESQGLIILTNDGELAFKLTHPSNRVEKEYLVKTARAIKQQDIHKILEGVVIERQLIKPKKVIKLKMRARSLRFVLTEGKKHEVRRLCKKAQLIVKQLKRIRIGSLELGKLPVGSYKQLSYQEICALTSAAQSPCEQINAIKSGFGV